MDRFLEMQVFTTVVDTGSFVGATDKLAMSKAAVSRHVNALEARLGVRLLNRTTRRLSLTPEGDVFLNRCRTLLDDLGDAERELSSHSASVSGLLRINVPVTFGIRRLAPLWAGFMAQHPEARLDISLVDRTVDLIEEGFDLTIRVGFLEDSSLVARRLTTSRMVVCASSSYLEQYGTPSHPNELASHSIIAYSYWSKGDKWVFDGPDGEVSVRVSARLQCNNGDTCLVTAIAGQGIIMQPDFIVEEALNEGDLIEILPDYSAGEPGIYAIYPTRRHLSPKVRACVDYLAEQLG